VVRVRLDRKATAISLLVVLSRVARLYACPYTADSERK